MSFNISNFMDAPQNYKPTLDIMLPYRCNIIAQYILDISLISNLWLIKGLANIAQVETAV